MVRVRAPWGIARELRTSNLVLKEWSPASLHLADYEGWPRDLLVRTIYPYSVMEFEAPEAHIYGDESANSTITLHSHDGSVDQSTIILKGGLAELARCKLTGELNCNSQTLSNGNFQGSHKLVGVNADLWRNMGPIAFNNHFLPSGMLEYTTAGSPTITWANDYLGFKMPTSGTASAQFVKKWHGLSGEESWDKDRYFGARVWVDPHTDMGMWIATGNADTYYGTSCNKRHFGFVLDGSSLYPTCANGTNQTLGTAVTVSASYLRLEAVLHAATDTIDYYKNGTFLQTLSSNVPNGTTDAWHAWHWNVWDYSGYNVGLYLYVVRVYQEP